MVGDAGFPFIAAKFIKTLVGQKKGARRRLAARLCPSFKSSNSGRHEF